MPRRRCAGSDGSGPRGTRCRAVASASARSILRVESLSKTFPGTKALSDVNIDVKAGQIHALVGHNGSGKSTLIKVLSGYHSPDPGAQAWLDGEPVDITDSRPRHGPATPPG